MDKIQLKDIRIEKLNYSHSLISFYSYDKDLENFLQNDALNHQLQNICITFLWFYNNNLVSYISLLADRITLETDLQHFFQQKGIYYKTLPALKIGRLCVDNRFLGMGLGSHMVKAAYQKAIQMNSTIAGCRFLTVDAKVKAIPFYEKFGFYKLRKTSNTLILDLKLHQHS